MKLMLCIQTNAPVGSVIGGPFPTNSHFRERADRVRAGNRELIVGLDIDDRSVSVVGMGPDDRDDRIVELEKCLREAVERMESLAKSVQTDRPSTALDIQNIASEVKWTVGIA